jgi:hypothetical protein
MVVTNRRFLAVPVLALSLATAALAGGGQDARAIDLLQKSMGREFPVNVIAVIMQRDPVGDGTYQRVKVTRARDGRMRHTILQPLRMAGVESVDDGMKMKVYLPDKRALIVQDSGHSVKADTDARLSLAKKNYQFSIDGRERIAGRTTLRIVADPKDPDMAMRRYYLEEKSGYPLKMEVVGERGEPKVVFDTIAIDFPTQLTGNVFRMKPLPGTNTINYTRPQTLSSAGQAQSIVGFRPVLPDKLPMGFKVQEMQYNGGDEWKSVVIRLSDGLVRATVYQWKANGKKIEAIEDSTLMEVNGLKLLLVSDLPPHVRSRLLQSFVGQAKADSSPRAMRLIGMLSPTVPGLVNRSELLTTIWTFAQLDSRAGLGDCGLPPGVPVYSALR